MHSSLDNLDVKTSGPVHPLQTLICNSYVMTDVNQFQRSMVSIKWASLVKTDLFRSICTILPIFSISIMCAYNDEFEFKIPWF